MYWPDLDPWTLWTDLRLLGEPVGPARMVGRSAEARTIKVARKRIVTVVRDREEGGSQVLGRRLKSTDDSFPPFYTII